MFCRNIFIVFTVCFLLSIFLFASNFNEVGEEKIVLFEKLTTPSLNVRLKPFLKCHDKELYMEKIQHGSYWLVRNLIIGRKSKKVKCAETITYTTNGDYTFLDNLPIVISNWRAPISFALFTPGLDVDKTIESIQYLRNCIPESDLIRDYVSFHIYFPNNHMPKRIPLNENEAENWNYTCVTPPFLNVDRNDLYKTRKKLTYPINVGRNIARNAANTYFIFPCDIELIPSPNIPSMFLEMIALNKSLIQGNNGLRVFPMPVFELHSNATIPKSKSELVSMLKTKMAIPFHAEICFECHLVPQQNLWMNTTDQRQMTIITVGKRIGDFRHWEPFYISNNNEPIFDERVTWEGQSNKRIQNYAMCLLNYEYLVVHPAFLTHKPGIKYYESESSRYSQVPAMNRLIKQKIQPEYLVLYGNTKGCVT